MNWQGINFGVSAMLKWVRREFGWGTSIDSKAIIIRKPFSLKVNVSLSFWAVVITTATILAFFAFWGENGLFHHLNLLSK
jgi:hypothetical protein